MSLELLHEAEYDKNFFSACANEWAKFRDSPAQ